MNEQPDVIPFPRKIGMLSRIGLEACLLVALIVMLCFASAVAKDLHSLGGELTELRKEMAKDAKQFEDARKRHAIQAATLMLELEHANERAKLLTQSLRGTK